MSIRGWSTWLMCMRLAMECRRRWTAGEGVGGGTGGGEARSSCGFLPTSSPHPPAPLMTRAFMSGLPLNRSIELPLGQLRGTAARNELADTPSWRGLSASSTATPAFARRWKPGLLTSCIVALSFWICWKTMAPCSVHPTPRPSAQDFSSSGSKATPASAAPSTATARSG